MISVLALYTLFGSTFALSKLLLMQTTPLFAVGSRMALGGILLLCYVYFTRTTNALKKSDIILYAQLTLFNVIVPYSLRLWSMQYISSIKAALLFNLSPFLTAFFAYLALGDSVTLRQFIGLVIGFLGMIPVLLTQTGSEIATDSFISLPEIAALISTASISYSLVIMQKLVKHKNCPVPLANGVSMFAGGTLTLILAYFFESPLIKTTTLAVGSYALLQALVINVGCANWRAYLLKRYSSTFMSFASLLAPLSATLYGWLFFDELLSWNFAYSFVLVLIGLGIYFSHE